LDTVPSIVAAVTTVSVVDAARMSAEGAGETVDPP